MFARQGMRKDGRESIRKHPDKTMARSPFQRRKKCARWRITVAALKVPSWNPLMAWLREMEKLRVEAG